MSVRAYFTEDHRACDELWAALEQAMDRGTATLGGWLEFERAMRRHLGMEEEILFPAIEQATGLRGGPIAVMLAEHAQMRGLLDQMSRAAESGEFDALLDLGDTLLMLTQQHNVKEEHVLYPMADHALDAEWDGLSQRLAAFRAA
jgi:hemerythrin-like domain-containing protein